MVRNRWFLGDGDGFLLLFFLRLDDELTLKHSREA
jgi:hypothetical protein